MGLFLYLKETAQNPSEGQLSPFIFLSSVKIMIIFNNTSADFVLISADVLLKMIILLIELRIAQLCS